MPGRPDNKFNIQVWNRTDLSVTSGLMQYAVAYQNFKTFKYIGDVPGLLMAAQGQPQKYAGETIPKYACMRIAGPMVWIDDEPTYPVCLPDDTSQSFQEAGLHFFNGPTPIPLDGIGWATQTLPAQALVDMTPDAPKQSYGLSPAQTLLGQNEKLDIGAPLGIMSGCWALHNFNDPTDVNISVLNQWPELFPYTLMSYVPLRERDKNGDLQYTQPYAMVGTGAKVYILNAGGFISLAGS